MSSSLYGFSAYEPIKHELKQVEEHLLSLCQDKEPSIREFLAYVVEGRGKLVRPALTVLASKFHRCADPQLPIIMASAVELLHLATLIHDDTVDHAPLRRGRATISQQWGKDVAILVGDYVFATSATVVCETGNVRVIRRFSETIMELSQGELTETFSAYNWQQSWADYWKRIYLKTASLFATAAESGAVLSGAAEPVVQALKEYGTNLGLAFQVVDDILDFQGTQDEIGKPAGHDLSEGIVTLPALLLMERYPANNVIPLALQSEDRHIHVERALHLAREDSILEAAYDTVRALTNKAQAALEPLEDNEHRQFLMDFATSLAERRS